MGEGGGVHRSYPIPGVAKEYPQVLPSTPHQTTETLTIEENTDKNQPNISQNGENI